MVVRWFGYDTVGWILGKVAVKWLVLWLAMLNWARLWLRLANGVDAGGSNGQRSSGWIKY